MNIVSSSGRLMVYGDDVETFDKLPVDAYKVGFNELIGFYLEKRQRFDPKEKKIYGNTREKVKKTLDSFEACDRNFGVMLSGRKGVGKTLFAKLLSHDAMERGYPVITVDRGFNGVEGFLEDITQECVVIFDEFDKNFGDGYDDEDDSDTSKQDSLLSMFDGLDGGKKLFVITYNEEYAVSDYLVNRPGRMHYHFSIGSLSAKDVEEYLSDNVKEEYSGGIQFVVGMSAMIPMTYDILKAIAFELNRGYSVEETLEDLNISKERVGYEITYTLKSGKTFTDTGYSDLFSRWGKYSIFRLCANPDDYGESDEYITVIFSFNNSKLDGKRVIIDGKSFKIKNCSVNMLDKQSGKFVRVKKENGGDDKEIKSLYNGELSVTLTDDRDGFYDIGAIRSMMA